MNIYYIVSNPKYIENYNFYPFIKSDKNIKEIQKEIQSIPDFCRDQQSINTNEIKGYIVWGISFLLKMKIK